MKSFASDNNSGVHPAVMDALGRANQGHVGAYGDDPWTLAAEEAFRHTFGPDARVFFVFLGTAANVLCLRALARSWESVVCASSAHINMDECGAPEQVAGCKLLDVNPSEVLATGKIGPGHVQPFLGIRGFEHRTQPRVISITQSTELGTLYQPEEIRELSRFARENDLYLHMDGARLANAAAALGVGLAELTAHCGVDALSFGGTKNGLMYGEAVVFFNPALCEGFKYVRKQGMQLASKMRFLSAQFSALFEGGLWRENASHANAMARRLAGLAQEVPGVEISRPVETNHVFARMPLAAAHKMQEDYYFYVWDPDASEVRWMTAFDTSEEDVDGFVAALREAMKEAG